MTQPNAWQCISLDLIEDTNDATPCERKAKFIVESAAGWSGKHCRKHALRVVGTMLSQVEADGYTVRIRKFVP